jgi:hypothetical protein
MIECIDELKLRKTMKDARANLQYAETDPKGRPGKALETLVTAQTKWADHKATCPICSVKKGDN